MVIRVIKIFFVQFFCVFLPPLLYLFCFFRFIPFLLFIVSIFVRNVSLIFIIFLKRFLVFPILLFSCFFPLITEEGFLISPCYSLELCIQMGLSFLYSFAFCFSSQLFVRQPSCFPAFLLLGDGFGHHLLYNVMNLCWQFFRHSIRSNPLNLFFTSAVQSSGIWFRLYLNGLMVFPIFFNLSLNLAIRSSWSEPQSALGLVFADCVELLHLWLQRT